MHPCGTATRHGASGGAAWEHVTCVHVDIRRDRFVRSSFKTPGPPAPQIKAKLREPECAREGGLLAPCPVTVSTPLPSSPQAQHSTAARPAGPGPGRLSARVPGVSQLPFSTPPELRPQASFRDRSRRWGLGGSSRKPPRGPGPSRHRTTAVGGQPRACWGGGGANTIIPHF